MNVTFAKPGGMDIALTAHREGRLAEAEAIYRRLLAEQPDHPEALHMLGVLALQVGNSPAAVELISRSLKVNPNSASACSNLAEAYRTAGHVDEAENLCRRAISLDPALSAAYVNLAMTLSQKGRSAEALPIALKAVELAPREAGAYTAAGMALSELGRIAESVKYLEDSLRINPNDPTVASSLGINLARIEQGDRARQALQHAVNLAPKSPQILLNMGAMLGQLEKFEESAVWVQRALDCDPNYILALEHMASIKTSLKKFDEAIDLCRRIIAIKRDAMDTWATMGEAMMNTGKFDETIAAMKEALAIKPWPTVFQSLSNALVRSGHPAEGLVELDKAIAMDPNNAVLHFNRAIILLLMGRLPEAWQEYEWRWQHPRMVGRTRRFTVPEWKGEQLEGKRIFLHAEQGFGDTLFFGRYATQIARDFGGKPVMWVQTSMVELAKTIPGVAEVVGEGMPVPPFDCHLPIMSLPRVFNTSLENVPHEVPYVKSDPVKKEFWKQEFEKRTKKFKIGLVWEGGAFQPENFLRSNSLAAYAPLADIPGVAFFGLQKGPAEAQADNPPAGMDFTNLGPYIKDFSDTAAILDNLDLLISIDTSVVHVAGALALPIWMLLAWSPGHMWMFEREDSPWYPTMKIYRQPAFKDWATPVARVKKDLLKLMAERGSK